jgi:hypothetical protein
LEYHLLLARDLKLFPAATYEVLEREVDGIQRMLTALIRRVQPVRGCSHQIKVGVFEARS